METLSLLYGGGTQAWAVAALLVCLFWTAVLKPERIRSLAEFRIACLLLALAIIAPTLAQLFVLGSQAVDRPFGPQHSNDFSSTVFASAIGPLLLTFSVILGLDSVIPRGKIATSNQPLQPHATPHAGSET